MTAILKGKDTFHVESLSKHLNISLDKYLYVNNTQT